MFKKGLRTPSVGAIIGAVICLVIAGVILYMGNKSYARYKDLSERCTKETGGVVYSIYVDVEERETDDSVYYDETDVLTVKYSVKGKELSVKVRDGSQSCKVGDKLTVVYDPDDPETSYVKEFAPEDKRPLAYGIAAFFIILAMVMMIL